MTRLTDATREEVFTAIDNAGRGIISSEWKEAAWEAIRTWISGRLASSPYGFPVPSPLTVEWRYDDGTLTVYVYH